MAERRRVLLLGGTGEAAALATCLSGDARVDVTTSLAGRTRAPAALAGQVRTGGFGGADGLAAYLSIEKIDLLIDATHPYAARMPHAAAGACERAGVPRLRLWRPAWMPQKGDRWIAVADLAAAAMILPGLAQRVFLTTGQRDLTAFATLTDTWFLIRLIEPPDSLPLAQHRLILARGPFRPEDELSLMRKHRIEAVVSKNSGGTATYGKIAAARALRLPVLMLDRPAPPDGELADTIEACLAWLDTRLD
jgi:precorrin-6A/cobalt-precorrin-6A reductase